MSSFDNRDRSYNAQYASSDLPSTCINADVNQNRKTATPENALWHNILLHPVIVSNIIYYQRKPQSSAVLIPQHLHLEEKDLKVRSQQHQPKKHLAPITLQSKSCAPPSTSSVKDSLKNFCTHNKFELFEYTTFQTACCNNTTSPSKRSDTFTPPPRPTYVIYASVFGSKLHQFLYILFDAAFTGPSFRRMFRAEKR